MPGLRLPASIAATIADTRPRFSLRLTLLFAEADKRIDRPSVTVKWTQDLPDKIRTSLESLVDTVNQHEDSYMNADNASVGQIWIAMAMMNNRVEKLEELVTAQRKALNDAGIDMDRRLDEKLERSLRKY